MIKHGLMLAAVVAALSAAPSWASHCHDNDDGWGGSTYDLIGCATDRDDESLFAGHCVRRHYHGYRPYYGGRHYYGYPGIGYDGYGGYGYGGWGGYPVYGGYGSGIGVGFGPRGGIFIGF